MIQSLTARLASLAPGTGRRMSMASCTNCGNVGAASDGWAVIPPAPSPLEAAFWLCSWECVMDWWAKQPRSEGKEPHVRLHEEGE